MAEINTKLADPRISDKNSSNAEMVYVLEKIGVEVEELWKDS